MKKHIFKFLLFTLLIPVAGFLFTGPLYSQEYKWIVYPSLGIDMGGALPIPLSTLPKGIKGTPKLAPNVGLGFGYRLNDKWSLSGEVSYHVLAFSARANVRSQPFFSDNGQALLYFTGETFTDVELRFVEIPVIAGLKMGKNWSLLFGAYYSGIIEGTFYTEGKNGVLSDDKNITDNAQLPGVANTSYNFNDYIDNYDVGIMAGYLYRVSKKIWFRGRLCVGFKSIFQKDFENIDYEMYQVRLDAGVSYALFSRWIDQ